MLNQPYSVLHTLPRQLQQSEGEERRRSSGTLQSSVVKTVKCPGGDTHNPLDCLISAGKRLPAEIEFQRKKKRAVDPFPAEVEPNSSRKKYTSGRLESFSGFVFSGFHKSLVGEVTCGEVYNNFHSGVTTLQIYL